MKLFVPFVSGALLAFALSGCSPSNNSGNNAATENAVSALPNTATDNSAVISTTGATPTATQRESLLANVWVPGQDDKLHQKPVSKAALATQKKFGDPTAAIAEIVKMAPKSFPPQTRVLDYHDDGKSVSVNLNRNFEDPKFWSQAGENGTLLAVYALVNSASEASGTGKPVVLKVEKRPVGAVGETDMEGEITPEPKYQAKAGSSKATATAGSEAGTQ